MKSHLEFISNLNIKLLRVTWKFFNIPKPYPKLLNFGPWAKLVTFYFSLLIFLISFKSKSQSNFGLIVKAVSYTHLTLPTNREV